MTPQGAGGPLYRNRLLPETVRTIYSATDKLVSHLLVSGRQPFHKEMRKQFTLSFDGHRLAELYQFTHFPPCTAFQVTSAQV
jgi:hypothetical protein